MNRLGTDPRSPVRRDGAMQSQVAASSTRRLRRRRPWLWLRRDAARRLVDFLLSSSYATLPISLHSPILSFDSSDVSFFSSLPYFLKAFSFSYKILFEFSSWLTIERTFSCVFLPFSTSYSLFITKSFFPPVFIFLLLVFSSRGIWNLIFLRFSCFPSHPSHAWLEFEQDQRNKIFWIPGEQKRKFLRWVGWHAISSVFQCFHNATTNDRETHYKMQSATSLLSLSLPIVEDT